MKQITPALNKASFTCPHCRANAAQTWFPALAKARSVNGTATLNDALSTMTEHLEMVSIGDNDTTTSGLRYGMNGVKFSKCYSCSGVAVWVGPRIVWPATDVDVFANPDMPADVKSDFEEAAAIVKLSPRGA